MNRTQRPSLARLGARLLVVWLVSALLTFGVIGVMAWSGVKITEGIELLLLIQPAPASVLMAWWRWSPAEAPEDITNAIGRGRGAAVAVVWASVVAISVYRALNPPPDALPLSVWGIFMTLLVFSVLALLTGQIGGAIGALVAKHVRRERRGGHLGPTGVS